MAIYTYVRNADPRDRTETVSVRGGALIIPIGSAADLTPQDLASVQASGRHIFVAGVVNSAPLIQVPAGYNGLNVPVWQPNTVYPAGFVVQQAGQLYDANATFASGATFNLANWTLLSGSGGGLSQATADGLYIHQDGTGTPTSILAGVSAARSLSRMDRLGPGNVSGLKIRGANFAPNPAVSMPNGSFGNWAQYLGSAFSATFIDTQVSQAQAVGVNAVSVYLDLTDVLATTTTIATYLANLTTTLNKIQAGGLFCHITLVGFGSGTPTAVWAPITGLTGANSVATLLPYVAQLAALVDTYPNVIGIDLSNESNMPWLQTQLGAGVTMQAYLAALLPTVRANTNKPLTASYQLGSAPNAGISSDTNLQWIAANLDYMDYHVYYGLLGPTGAGNSPNATDLQVLATAFPGKAIILGETGSSLTSGDAQAPLATAMPTIRKIWELPFIAGGFIWSLNAFRASLSPSAIFDSAGVEHTNVGFGVRTLPRRTTYEGQVYSLPGAGTALTTSLADVPNALVDVGAPDLDASQNRTPQIRVTGVFSGLVGGDVAEVALIDTAGPTQIALAQATAPGVGSVFTDVSPSVWNGTLSGPITTPASGVAGFGNWASLSQAQAPGNPAYINFGQHALGTTRWTHELFVKRTRLTTAETFLTIAGPTGFPSLQLGFDAADNIVIFHGSGSVTVNTGIKISDTTTAHHIAYTWDAGSVKHLHLDGTQIYTVTSANSMPTAAMYWLLGAAGVPGAIVTPFQGFLMEYRVSSVSRYTSAAFTPPAAPYTSDANTLLLAHLDAINTGPANQRVTAKSEWFYPGPISVQAKLQAANLQFARGTLARAQVEVRYA